MILTDIEYSKHAMACYDNPSCVSVQEFQDDIRRPARLNRYLSNIETWSPDISRRILNSLIIIYNIFGDGASQMLEYKISSQNKPKLRALQNVIGRQILNDCIDEELLEKLKCL